MAGEHRSPQPGRADGHDVVVKPKRHRRTKAEMIKAREEAATKAVEIKVEEKKDVKKTKRKRTASNTTIGI